MGYLTRVYDEIDRARWYSLARPDTVRGEEMGIKDDVSRMSKNELEREVRELRAKVARLESAYKRTTDDERIDQAMMAGALHAAVAEARGQRDEYREKLEALEVVIDDYFRMSPYVLGTMKIEPPPGVPEERWKKAKFNNTIVTGVVYYRDNNEPKPRAYVTTVADYPGTADEFENEVIPQLVFAMTRMVLPDEIVKKTVDGLSNIDKVNIILELDPVKDDYETYLKLRDDIFKRVWPLMQASGMYDYPKGQHAARDKFNAFCDNTLMHREKRLSKWKLPEPEEGRTIDIRKLFSDRS